MILDGVKRALEDDDIENNYGKKSRIEYLAIDITDMNYHQYNLVDSITLEHIRSINIKNINNFESILNRWGMINILNFQENDITKYNIFHKMINLDSLVLINCLKTLNITFLIKCTKLKTLVINNININTNGYNIWVFPKNLTNITITGIKLDYIPNHLFNCNKIEYLDLSNTNITHISGDISNLYNLKHLNISNNPIHNLPEEMSKLVHLEYLNISKTNINKISNVFDTLINLKELQAFECQIEKITGIISKTIEILNLRKNILTSIPKYFSDFENLKYLSLERNGIYEMNLLNTKFNNNLIELQLQMNLFVSIPDWVYNCVNLKTLNISGNNISIISENIKNLIYLESLNMYCNLLTTVPIELSNLKSLKFLSLKNNMIENIPVGVFSGLDSLAVLLIDENYLTSLPDDILSLGKSLFHISYTNNPFIDMSKRIKMFVEMLSGQKDNFLYTDKQSVHDRQIQQSFIDSIKNLQALNMDVNNNKVFNEWIVDKTLSSNCKDEIYKMYHDKTLHVTLNMTYIDVFNLVWTFMHNQEISNITPEAVIEIKSIMSQGIMDVANMCFTGKTTMLINCLCGFTDKVNIGLTESEELGNIIIAIKRQLIAKGEYSVNKHKENVIKNMKERGITDEVISVWVDNITEE